MPKRSAASTCVFPVLALSLLCLLSPGISAQKSTATVSGAPLKGVDVKLARYAGAQFSGASPAAITKTDENGNFTFPILPRGEYVLTISLPEHSKTTPDTAARGGFNNPGTTSAVKYCYIRLNLPEGRKLETGYDLAQNKAFDPKVDPTKESTSKAIKFEPLIIVSNGVEPCNGTIVKSKSNITNN